MPIPIKIHPQNPKIFEFRGKPLKLLTATEHYGSVINRPFDFEKYLVNAYENKMTLSRLFMLFREQQTSINPYSTCKPESPDFISPFLRVGPDKALDMQPKYDLDNWNPEFFARLHKFLSLASEYGIIVEVVLLSNTYTDEVWNLNPLNSENNINNTEKIKWYGYNTKRNPKILYYQLKHVKKIVEETLGYDNIIYEICNEPCGGLSDKPEHPTANEVNEWQMEIAKTVKETESDLEYKHLIAGQEAVTYTPFRQTTDKTFNDLCFDVANVHPLPNTIYKDKEYDLGNFMSKELKLKDLKDYCVATYDELKPLNYDEDNIASQYKDYDGWTIHRKRAWMTLLCGGHYDYIDFSIINYSETGTEQSNKYIRSWFKYLSEYIHSINLVNAKPIVNQLKAKPNNTLEAVYGIEGEDYSFYLADCRELKDGEGEFIVGKLKLDLPDRKYIVSCYSPETGLYSPWIEIRGGNDVKIGIPEFRHDIVIRIVKK